MCRQLLPPNLGVMIENLPLVFSGELRRDIDEWPSLFNDFVSLRETFNSPL